MENPIEQLLSKQEPFAIYRIPGESKFSLLMGKVSNEFDGTKKGFVFHPFDSEKHPTLFLESRSTLEIDIAPPSSFPSNTTAQTKPSEEYLEMVIGAMEMIRSGLISKVVISRCLDIEFLKLDKYALLSALAHRYSNAFVYCFSHPDSGTWVGATPETLITKTGDQFNTMSLAGTKPSDGTSEWTGKEIEEQEIVTRYISEKLEPLASGEIKISQAQDIKAGPITHIGTTFKFSSELDLKVILNTLHPTPAIAGVPKEKAVEIIHSIEPHEREYYSGYVGPIDGNNSASLFVNLRCMKILDNSCRLFLGGGITAESIPEKEWIETENKAETLLSVIRNLMKLAPDFPDAI